MSPKEPKKPLWIDCGVCGCSVISHNKNVHIEQNCKKNQMKCPYIEGKKLYSCLDTSGSLPKDIPMDSFLIHQSTALFLGCVPGNPIQLSRDGAPTLLRRMWPSKDSHLGALMCPAAGLPEPWCSSSNKKVTVSALSYKPPVASQITIKVLNRKADPEFCRVIKHHFWKNYISVGSILILPYWFGRKLEIIVTGIKSLNHNESDRNWYVLSDTSMWNLEADVVKNIKKPLALGGVDDILREVTTFINISFDVKLKSQPIRGLLLYGQSGVGKTAMCKYLAEITNCFHIDINGPAVFSKYSGETEMTLKSLFKKAIQNEPSIVIIDEIDTICPKTNSGSIEQEKRITSAVASLLDNLHKDCNRVIVLATTRKPESINPTLRRYGRLGQELEIPVPDKIRRNEILYTLLRNIKNKMSSSDIESISDLAHGYVAADLMNLCTQASMKCAERLGGDVVERQDLIAAMTVVSPSSMRELLIEVPNVRWSDIGGQANVKLKLQQAVEWPLKHGDRFRRLGIKPPAGVLLYGPPGCSKTMIAKALATESGLNFLSIKGPEIFSKWVGESERAVRDLFTKARQVAPSVIFFDEIDAIGGERGAGEGGVEERIVAQLLTELDGIVSLHSVTILAATNRPDKMDRALLRPGRLDRLIYVPLPDLETRLQILELKLKKMATSDDINPHSLSIRTEGFSGAELVSLCQEAALSALEKDLDCPAVSMEHFEHILKNFIPRTPNHLLKLYEDFASKQ